jgi:hypothetical protein
MGVGAVHTTSQREEKRRRVNVKFELLWEEIEEENVDIGDGHWMIIRTARAEFIRGWIVRTRVLQGHRNGSAQLTAETKCFIPDENAQW